MRKGLYSFVLALLGTVYEQYPQPGRGNHPRRAGVQLGDAMRYRIERTNGQHCHFANSRKLLAYLKHAPAGTVTDIRKVYKSGVTDSVIEIYFPYIRTTKPM